MGKLRNKIIAGIFGMLAGASFIAVAQVPGPVNLRGSGGAIQELTISQLGSGGSSTFTQGAYTVHVFTGSGAFTPPTSTTLMDVLVVGGGGGGGGNRYGGGGGGAGGARWTTGVAVEQVAYTVTVGAGGAGGLAAADATANGANGNASSFIGGATSLAASGGGGGGRGDALAAGASVTNASGGGGGATNTNGSAAAGGTGTVLGNNGGAGRSDTNQNRNGGGGGGGASGIGATATNASGGNGGAGMDRSTEFPTLGAGGFFAGGGGGGKRTGTAGIGGTGGGGTGSVAGAGTNAGANTGGGGGGAGGTTVSAGGSGAAGIVVIRYLTPPSFTYIVHTFTSSGTFTPPAGVSSVEVLAVGGGGGGGRGSATSSGGGGGGGAVVTNTAVAVTPLSNIAVTVGGGGGGATIDNTAGGSGTSSVLGIVSAAGGGGGGAGSGAGQNGASGGGGGANDGTSRAGGSASAGFAGGASFGNATANNRAGGGGGGAGAVGADGANLVGGNGGAGVASTLTGSSLDYAGGGGGAGATGGAGGSGVGASGASGSGAPGTPGVNRGGGGGGTRDANASSGASGVVVIRYRPPTMSITTQASIAVSSAIPFSQQPVVRLLDYQGNAISGVNVTAALESGTGTLGGTTIVATDASGFATFTDLQITGAPGTFQLGFTANGSTQEVVTNNILMETYDFRIAHDASALTCSAENIAVTVATTTSGVTLTRFTGTIALSTSTNAGGWGAGTGLGTLANLSDGAATYTFDTNDNGNVALQLLHPAAGTVDIDILQAAGAIVENPGFDPALTVATCTGAPVLLSQACYDTNSGTIAINAGSAGSNRLLVVATSRAGALSASTTPPAATATFNGGALTQIGTTGFYDNASADTMTQIYAMTESTTPALPPAAGTYTATVQALGAITRMCLFYFEDMSQTLPTGTARASQGTQANPDSTTTTAITTQGPNAYVLSAVTGTPNNVTYTGFTAPMTVRLQSSNGTASTFGVSGGVIATASTNNITEVSSGNNTQRSHVVASFVPAAPVLDHFLVTHGGTGSICANNEVTIAAIDQYGAVFTSYVGTVTLETTAGDWAAGSGQGVVTNGVGGDGDATYQFSALDAGIATLHYTNSVLGTVNFDVTDGGIEESVFFDPSFTLQTCYVRIAHSGNGDVCSPEAVTLSVVNASGVTQVGYTGTLTLSVTPAAANGISWAEATPQPGTLTDNGSGNATYQMVDADDGEVVLNLNYGSISASVDIDVTTGSFQEQSGYDPVLNVTGCKFRVSYASQNVLACEPALVTLDVYDSGGNPATQYTGTVSLSTNPAHGDWLSATGGGTLTDTTSDDGTATYSFVTGDAGSVDLSFFNTHVESLNIDATANSGAITIDSAFDPDLNVTSCLPAVSDSACYANQNQANAIDVLSEGATLASRMVLMYISSESDTNSTGATLNGAAMTLLRREPAVNPGGSDVILEVYGILDVNLPDAAGAYAAAFTGSANNPAMCLVSVWGVEQVFPQTNTPATSGQLNGSNLTASDPITAGITTLQNNSLIVSVVANGQGNSTYTSTLSNEMWNGGVADAFSADWAGHYGHQPMASAITVTEDSSRTPNRQAMILLALTPAVLGDPAASGYVPITLFQTWGGNINYRAVGNTLRTSSNAVDACAMQPTATGSTATVTLPAGSTIEAAFLYWAGSGEEIDIDAAVSFGLDGSQVPIIADETFFIEPNQVYNPSEPAVPESFFAAYKDVSGLISSGTTATYRFSDLTMRTDFPWDFYDTCLGGWALVVVYENVDEYLNVINLFHGFQPFWHSSLTLVPRNFRMAAPNDATNVPHGQISHITFEGDANVLDPDITTTTEEEVLQLQDDPTMQTFANLTNAANPQENQYNDTVSFPTYDINLNFTGYSSTATSYGTDVDTYYVIGDQPGELLYPFGVAESEQILTRHATGQDIILLAGEVIAVTNAPIADLEVFVDDDGDFKVDTLGLSEYTYQVRNNGNGALSGGFADGDVILTGNMPMGITINTINADGWNCALATATAFTCVFDIAADWTTLRGAATAGELAQGEYLPTVQVLVDVADEVSFPLLDNAITTVARAAQVGSYAGCPAEPAGVQPDPDPATGCTPKSPQFDNINDLNNFLIDIDDLDAKTGINNNVHSVTTNVRGIETDLGIVKTVGTMEANQGVTYQLVVTNYGPDATTKTITVTDTLPSGLVPNNFGTTDPSWSCGAAGQVVTCTRSAALGVGISAPAIQIVTAPIVAPAVEGAFVSNTGTVAIGTYNFDNVGGNNSSTVIKEVTGPLADGAERFLLSANESSTIGGVSFDDGDLVLYDPVADTAEMFLAEGSIPGTTDLGNVDALHMLPNGHLVLSTALDGASIDGVTFNAEDLVLYDPILQVATLLFDGSTVFSADTADIDALHVNYNNSYDPADWTLALSTADAATILDVGAMPGDLVFDDNDAVLYDMATNEATLLLDGASADVFGGAAGDIGSLYIRYTDPDLYVIGTSDTTATLGPTGAQTTIEGTELAALDMNGAATTSPLLCDSDAPCVGMYPADFTPASATRRLDGVHMIENGYFGHFSISSIGGDTCSATAITLSKHAGLSHTVETYYTGAVRISNNLGAGVWAKDVTANGTLHTSGYGLGAGEAIYVFDPADAGEVILYITGTTATNTFNAHVTNGIGVENAPAEDPNIIISDLVTPITYSDQFSTAAYNNNDGIAGFATAWTETSDDGSASTGKVRIVTDTDELRFNNLGGGQPTLTREIDFSTYSVDQPPALSFDWRIAGNPSGTFVVEARGDDDDAWTTLQSFVASSGSGSSTINFTEAPHSIVVSATTQIRFRVQSGYSGNASEFFFVDDVAVSTETNDCGVGDTVDHYAIVHGGSMISCLAEYITIEPHTVSELVTAPGLGVMLTLNAFSSNAATGRGFWGPPTNGTGAFTAGDNDGQATYVFQPGEEDLVFPYFHTGIVGDTDTITFSVQDTNIPVKTSSVTESPSMLVSRAGLRFYNQTSGDTVLPTLVAGMPASAYPGNILEVQAVRASDNDPTVCEAVFPDNTDIEVELAFECINPASCSDAPAVDVAVTNSVNVAEGVPPVDSNSGAGVAGGFQSVTLRFVDYGAYNAARIDLSYADAGELQVHGRYELDALDQAGAALLTGDYLTGSSNSFVVRPFGFSIDFSGDRLDSYGDINAWDGVLSYAADASDPDAFVRAGEPFAATVRAVSWQAADDANNDGVPDLNAHLFDNPTTRNYGNEALATDNDVLVSGTHKLPVAPGVAGTLGQDAPYDDFVNGEASHNLEYSEVGIIDIAAARADYLGGGEDVTGTAYNVGRFIPADFLFGGTTLDARPVLSADAETFTYLGEAFEVGFTLTARNLDGITTQNYVGDFAKLRTTANPVLFYAFDDLAGAADVDYTPGGNNTLDCSAATNTQRLCRGAAGDFDFTTDWTNGTKMFSGRLIFNRQLSAAEDGPFDDLLLGITVADSDAVEDLVNAGPNRIEVDDAADDITDTSYNLISAHTFRYGRIRLQNAYASEIPEVDASNVPIGEDLEVRVVAEYFNGSRFVPNTDDDDTPYDSARLGFVGGSYTDSLDAGEALIKAGVSGIVFEGTTFERGPGDTPLFLQAPDVGNDGSAIVELDLDTLGLRFLKYDWRSDGVLEDDITGGANTALDNPRAYIEFGEFRGNDRIINWQEIFE